jgi:hypothetical protein
MANHKDTEQQTRNQEILTAKVAKNAKETNTFETRRNRSKQRKEEGIKNLTTKVFDLPMNRSPDHPIS